MHHGHAEHKLLQPDDDIPLTSHVFRTVSCRADGAGPSVHYNNSSDTYRARMTADPLHGSLYTYGYA
jgi:hypothetical protein